MPRHSSSAFFVRTQILVIPTRSPLLNMAHFRAVLPIEPQNLVLQDMFHEDMFSCFWRWSFDFGHFWNARMLCLIDVPSYVAFGLLLFAFGRLAWLSLGGFGSRSVALIAFWLLASAACFPPPPPAFQFEEPRANKGPEKSETFNAKALAALAWRNILSPPVSVHKTQELGEKRMDISANSKRNFEVFSTYRTIGRTRIGHRFKSASLNSTHNYSNTKSVISS